MVRIGKIDDLYDVLTMLELCKKDLKLRHLNVWDENYPTTEMIYKDLESKKSVVNVIDGKVVAFLVMLPKKRDDYEEVYHDHDNYCLVKRVMVHPDYRRRGLAQEILEFVETQGFSSIRLTTRNTNVYSVNLYKKMGYSVVSEVEYPWATMQACEKILK